MTDHDCPDPDCTYCEYRERAEYKEDRLALLAECVDEVAHELAAKYIKNTERTEEP